MAWGSWFRPRDSKGRESRTLAFVGIAFTLVSARFVLGGFSADFGVFKFEVGTTPMIDYGAAMAAILSVWLSREWISQNKSNSKSNATQPEISKC